jgi:hypothetical protein
MKRFQILERACPAEIEEIFSDAEVPSRSSFARGDVRERMLDGDARTERGSPRWGGLELSEFLLLRFVGSDGDAAAHTARRLSAAGAQSTGAAHLGIEVHGVTPWFEGLDLARGARDDLGSQVDAEVCLGEQSRSRRAQRPGFGEHRAASLDDLLHNRAVHIGAVDVRLLQGEALSLDVIGDRTRSFLFGTIGGGHCARHDGGHVEVARDVLLVPIEPFGGGSV